MRSGRLRDSFVSSISSRVLTAALQFVCAPLYSRYLGSEAYAIVVLYLALSAVSNVLDFGFSQSINREISRRLNQPEHRAEIPGVLKSFETVYWLISAGVGLILVLAAPLLANTLHTASIDHRSLVTDMMLVGVAVGVQFPFTFYQGALAGFERQVVANSITAVFAVPRILGSLLILACYAPTIVAFLWWQIMVCALQSVAYGLFAWKACETRRLTGVFDRAHFVRVRGFLTGAGVASLLSSLVLSSDKFAVSMALPLELAGRYGLGSMPVVAVSMINTAVSTTFFPRFSRLVAAGDEAAVAKLYHASSFIASIALAAVALTLMFFAHQFLFAWSGNLMLANQMDMPLRLLSLALLFNGLLTLPYVVQLAYGWTGLGVSIAAGALVCMPPAMYFLSLRYGLVGAPMAWLFGSVAMFVLHPAFMYRRILVGHGMRWLLGDIALPVGIITFVAWGIRLALPETSGRLMTFGELLITATILGGVGLAMWSAHRGNLPRFARARS